MKCQALFLGKNIGKYVLTLLSAKIIHLTPAIKIITFSMLQEE